MFDDWGYIRRSCFFECSILLTLKDLKDFEKEGVFSYRVQCRDERNERMKLNNLFFLVVHMYKLGFHFCDFKKLFKPVLLVTSQRVCCHCCGLPEMGFLSNKNAYFARLLPIFAKICVFRQYIKYHDILHCLEISIDMFHLPIANRIIFRISLCHPRPALPTFSRPFRRSIHLLLHHPP